MKSTWTLLKGLKNLLKFVSSTYLYNNVYYTSQSNVTHAHTQIYSFFPKCATQFKIFVLELTVLSARNSKLPPLLTNFPLFSYDASQP